MRTAPAACSDVSKPESILSVSGEVPEPTKATLFDARDQLAPLPLIVPFRMTLPGASRASAPPELKLDPDSSVMVAPAPLPERATTGNPTSETATRAAPGLLRVITSVGGSVASVVPFFPEVEASAPLRSMDACATTKI